MSIGRIDLNLLKVFEAVYEDRNLVRAGKRIHLTPSAVSHALGRLRELVGDELFMRTGKGMVPTGRAAAMAPILRESLHQIEASLGSEAFDPRTSVRRFVLAANDHVTEAIVVPLSRRLQEEAPHIDLIIRPSTRLDLAEQIDLGRIDLAIGIFAQVPPRLNSQALLFQRETILMRKGHPAARRALTLRDLTKYPLVIVSVGGPEEGAVGGFIVERGLARQSEMFDRHALEDALASTKAKPRLRLTVPHALAIPSLLRDTSMLSIVPESLGLALISGGALVGREPPYKTQGTTIRAIWHGRSEHDAGHRWLRTTLADASLAASPPAKAGRR
jgi:DNA-binding transcriptional LysR family regulator